MMIANGEDFYPGNLINGLQSAARGAHTRSLIFKPAPPILKVIYIFIDE